MALNEIGVLRTEVHEAFQTSGRFPPSRSEKPRDRSLRSLAVENNGRIVGVLAFPEVAELDGKRVVYEPRVEGGALVEWRCTSDAPDRYLPAPCRKGS